MDWQQMIEKLTAVRNSCHAARWIGERDELNAVLAALTAPPAPPVALVALEAIREYQQAQADVSLPEWKPGSYGRLDRAIKALIAFPLPPAPQETTP